jgi:hypothetical protein
MGAGTSQPSKVMPFLKRYDLLMKLLVLLTDRLQMLPYLIEQHKAGHLPLEKIAKYYKAADFQNAFDDMHAARTIKPVLVWSD